MQPSNHLGPLQTPLLLLLLLLLLLRVVCGCLLQLVLRLMQWCTS
jgi:hypothetical protein